MRAFCEVLGGRCHVSLTVSLGFSDSEKKKKMTVGKILGREDY